MPGTTPATFGHFGDVQSRVFPVCDLQRGSRAPRSRSMQAQRRRPLSVTILAVLAGLACVVDGLTALLFLSVLPIADFGTTGFFGQALLGAVLCTILALIWGWVTIGLWNLSFHAWEFLIVFALVNVVYGAIALIGSTPWLVILPGMLASVLILVYSVSSGINEVFGPPGQPRG
jgi:hypothetical protein